MDFKAFKEENFDSVDWINDSLNSAPKEENKENYASNIVFKLQLFIQEINQSLEETALSVISNLPKLNRDIEVLSEQAKEFKSDLISIKEDINKLTADSDDKMNRLVHVDRIKRTIEEKLMEYNEMDNREG